MFKLIFVLVLTIALCSSTSSAILWWLFKSISAELTKLECGQYIQCNDNQRYESQAGYGEAPFLVEISVHDSTAQKPQIKCAGAILKPNAVLTSAKCINATDFPRRKVDVLYGSVNERELSMVKVVQVITQPIKDTGRGIDTCASNRNVTNGLSLLKLEKNLDFTLKGHDLVNSVCVYKRHDANIHDVLNWLRRKTIDLFGWFPENHCALVVRMDEKEGLGNLINISDHSNKFKPYQFQEGAPIVYLEKNRWTLIGVASKPIDPWGCGTRAEGFNLTTIPVNFLEAYQFLLLNDIDVTDFSSIQ